MLGGVTERIRTWIIGLFVGAINGMSRPEDRESAVRWLSQSRDILTSDQPLSSKAKGLNGLINSRATAKAVASGVGAAFSNYRKSNLPLSMKVAIPATLAAMPIVGGQAAGVAAFGGAIGLPVLLLIFLGAAGVTSIIESIGISPAAREDVRKIVETIIADERLRRASAALKAAMRDNPTTACRQDVPAEELALRASLLAMDPYEFERHVMSFFESAGLEISVTSKSNDLGVDGTALHPDGLLIVQCKRNATANKVGRPTVQQFKGVVEENGAVRGYIVTTSSFTAEAIDSAVMTDKIVLVDMDQLIDWHQKTPAFGPLG